MQGVTRRCQTPTLAGPSRNARYRHAQDSQACKRSGVRISLAPLVRSIIRTDRTGSTAAKYRNGGRMGRRTCVRIGIFRWRGLLARPADFSHCSAASQACHLGKLLFSGCFDICRLGRHPARASGQPGSDCCRVCRWSPRRRLRASQNPLPGPAPVILSRPECPETPRLPRPVSLDGPSPTDHRLMYSLIRCSIPTPAAAHRRRPRLR